MPYSELRGFEGEVQELLNGRRTEPSPEMWEVLLRRIGTEEAIDPMAHAGYTSELIWAILTYQPELLPVQRERIAGFVAITCLLHYLVAEPGSGVHVGKTLVNLNIVNRDDFDVSCRGYQVLTVEETHKLLQMMGFSDKEILRSTRLVLGGEFDQITSRCPGRRTVLWEDHGIKSPYEWEYKNRKPFYELTDLCGALYRGVVTY